MYKDNNRKCAYLEKGRAKQVVTVESKTIAENEYNQQRKLGQVYWYEMDEKGKQIWLDKAKARFEIRKFVEREENNN